MEINSWVDEFFHYDNQIRPKGNPRKKKEKQHIYKDCFSAFDIEVTNHKPSQQGFMYIWSFCLDKYVILGRTWDQFLYLCKCLAEKMKDREALVCHVHNLSYEWNWLQSFGPDVITEVFAMDPRKIVRCLLFDHIELRCSYILTNQPLSLLTQNMNVKHKKLSGEKFDYDRIRTPGMSLKSYELRYCINDVLGLCEALKVFYSIEGDNHYTIPMTSTGFVRRDVKKAIRNNVRYSYMKKWQIWENDRKTPSLKLMTVLNDSFRGGDTHTSRFITGKVIKDELSSDRSSSYPAEMINQLYPYAFHYMGPVSNQKFMEMVNDLGMAALVVVRLTNVRLNNPFLPDPYIPFHKVHDCSGYVLDNGRCIEFRSGIMSLNDIDLRIILHEYKIDTVEILDSWFATYKPLPQAVKDVIIDYFKRKTALKGIVGQELNYMLAKQKLNSVYGMSAYFPLKQTLIWTGDKFVPETKDEADILRKYNCKGFLPYQVGCWVTAYARLQLRRGMYIVGNENMLYCDTDSVKYRCLTHVPDFTKYNKKMKDLAIKNGSAAQDSKGKWHYLGQFEEEPGNKYFISLGAKKYCAENEGKVELTLAGVSKKGGARELEKLGGIKMFKPGTVFKDSAGLKAKYNDKPDIKELEINGEIIPIISNLYLEPTEYTLSIGKTNDYEMAISLAAQIWFNTYGEEIEHEYDVLDLTWL